MRKDMKKLLVLRGKGGRGRTIRERAAEDRHDYWSAPKRGPKRRRRDKWPEEYFSPLRRLLLRRCGQRWDDVYSEIREALRVRSAIDMHILQHLEDFVILRCQRIDGEVYDELGYGPLSAGRNCVAYVDEEGILRALPTRPRRRPAKSP